MNVFSKDAYNENSKMLLTEINKINTSLNALTECAADIATQLKMSKKIALFKLKKEFGVDVESKLYL